MTECATDLNAVERAIVDHMRDNPGSLFTPENLRLSIVESMGDLATDPAVHLAILSLVNKGILTKSFCWLSLTTPDGNEAGSRHPAPKNVEAEP